MRRLAVLVVLLACRVPSDGALEESPPTAEAPAPTDTKSEPKVQAPEDHEDDEAEDEGPEEVELEWPDAPFEVDLDGDGKPETVSWTCKGKSTVKVGEASYEEKHDYAELIACTTTSIDLDPTTPGRQLVFIGDEHEEAGPDRHVILNYSGGALSMIWAADADVSFLVDGSWVSETHDCDDVDLVFTTTTDTHRWVEGEVKTKTEVSKEKVEEGDCAEP